MYNSARYIMRTHKLLYLYLTLSLLLSSFFFSGSSNAKSARVIVGPISVVGQVSVAEQKILFNRFRENLNKSYHLVSHKVLELISEQGFSSIDIEDCTTQSVNLGWLIKLCLSSIIIMSLWRKRSTMGLWHSRSTNGL